MNKIALLAVILMLVGCGGKRIIVEDDQLAFGGDHDYVQAGDGGTAKAGDSSRAIVGARGTAIVGRGGVSISGDFGTSIAGRYGKATAGNFGTARIETDEGKPAYGTAVAGKNGFASVGYGKAAVGEGGRVSGGKRATITFFYTDSTGKVQSVSGLIGKNGLRPGVVYHLDENHAIRPYVETNIKTSDIDTNQDSEPSSNPIETTDP